MKFFATILLSIVIAAPLSAQTKPVRLHFALPEYNGSLTFEPAKWTVTELSAKPNGNEMGIRAEQGNLKMLGFLFRWPEKAPLTASGCRDEMLLSDKVPVDQLTDKREITAKNGTKIAIVSRNTPPKGNETWHYLRAFAASNDLCADLKFSSKQPIDSSATEQILSALQFDPLAKPTFQDAFIYATILWQHQALRGAAKSYEIALSRVDTSDDPLKWRRVVVDQLAMAYGMAGDLKSSRNVNVAAIRHDPTYPLYYYNLACADAEEGDAGSAREHLQQAFDRRANTLPNEKLPDPATDDSFLRLKPNKEFWAFVQSISNQEKN